MKNYKAELDGVYAWVHLTDGEPDNDTIFSTFSGAKKAVNEYLNEQLREYREQLKDFRKLKKVQVK